MQEIKIWNFLFFPSLHSLLFLLITTCHTDSSRGLLIIAVEDGYPFVEGTKNVLKCVPPSSVQTSIQWTATAGGRHVGDLLFFDNITREHNGRLVQCQISYSTDRDHRFTSAVARFFELKVYCEYSLSFQIISHQL